MKTKVEIVNSISHYLMKFYYFFIVIYAIALPLYYFLFVFHSYWFDELWTLAGVKENFNGFINNWMINDVHPILYNLSMWFYVRLFGFSEYATRFFSYIFYLSAIIYFIYYTRRETFAYRIILFVLLFNPLVIYFSLEVRSYAMAYFFAIVFILNIDTELTKRQSAILILLSNTHFFGLIFSGFFLLFYFLNALYVKNFNKLKQVIITGILSLIWFCYLVVFKNILKFDASGSAGYSDFKNSFLYFINQFRLPVFYNFFATEFFVFAAIITLLIILIHGFKSFKVYIEELKADKKFLVLLIVYISAVVFFLVYNYNKPILAAKYILVFSPVAALIFVKCIFISRPVNDIYFSLGLILLTLSWFDGPNKMLVAKTSQFQNHKKLWSEISQLNSDNVFVFKPIRAKGPYENTFFKTVTLYKELGGANFRVNYSDQKQVLFQSGNVILFIHETKVPEVKKEILPYLKASKMNYEFHEDFGSSGDLSYLVIKEN